MSSRARSRLFLLAAVVLLALPLLPEIVGTRRLVFRDAQITHWPWRRVAMEAWRERRVPFVNASASGGEPLLANPNSVLLYPTVLLETVVSPACAFNLHYLIHILWALLGARALARRLGLCPGPALLAGIAYAFSGMMLSYGSAFMNSGAAAAWLPWCAAALLDLARAGDARPRFRAAAAAAIAFGMQLLAGEPAISLLTALFAGALALSACLAGRAGRVSRTGIFGVGAIASAVAAAAIAAPLLLPLSAVVRFTYRGQHLYSERAFGASPLAVWRLAEWLFPRLSGDPGALGPGGHWQFALHPGDIVYIWCVSLGVVPLLLTASAAISRDFWDRRARWLAAGAALSLLFSFGPALPFYRALFSIALLRRLRYPIKFYLITTICVSLLAGLAAQSWKKRRSGPGQAILLGAVALFYAAAFAAARAGGELDRIVTPLLAGLKSPTALLLPPIRASLRGDALFGLAATVLVSLAILPRRRAPGGGHLLALATLLLAMPWGLALFVSADEKTLEKPPAILPSLVGPGRLYVSSSLPEFNVLLSGTAHPALPRSVSQFARVQIEEMIPATGSPFGIRYALDADPDGSYGSYDRLTSEAFSISDPAERCRLLRMLGVRWLLEDDSQQGSCGSPLTGFAVAGRRLLLSRIPDPLAPLRWVGRERSRASLSGALQLIRSRDFDPRTEIVLPGSSDRDAPESAGAHALLSAYRVDPDGASAQVEAASSGYVLFSRTFLAAWKARVDGSAARVVVANAHDLAVAVPAGRHRVEFQYDRVPFVAGAFLQAIAVFGLVLGVALLPASRAGTVR